MTIVYCAARNMYHLLPTTINSLLCNEPNVSQIYLIVEDNNLPFIWHLKIQVVNCNNYECIIKTGPNIDSRFTYIAMIRCMLSEILTEDKIIYLDVDTIVVDDISDLWYTNVYDNYVAAVAERNEYYNSGVMLMNLDYMRKHNSSKALYRFLESQVFTFPDQEAINNVFAGKIRKLPPKFNAWRITKDPYSTPFAIRHFTGKRKPWSNNPQDLGDVEL